MKQTWKGVESKEIRSYLCASASGYVFAAHGGCVLKIDTDMQIVRYAGKSAPSKYRGGHRLWEANFCKVSGIACSNRLNLPRSPTLFVVDEHSFMVCRIKGDMVERWAGRGTQGIADGPSLLASFDSPTYIDMAADGTLYVMEQMKKVIRVISSEGWVSTIQKESHILCFASLGVHSLVLAEEVTEKHPEGLLRLDITENETKNDVGTPVVGLEERTGVSGFVWLTFYSPHWIVNIPNTNTMLMYYSGGGGIVSWDRKRKKGHFLAKIDSFSRHCCVTPNGSLFYSVDSPQSPSSGIHRIDNHFDGYEPIYETNSFSLPLFDARDTSCPPLLPLSFSHGSHFSANLYLLQSMAPGLAKSDEDRISFLSSLNFPPIVFEHLFDIINGSDDLFNLLLEPNLTDSPPRNFDSLMELFMLIRLVELAEFRSIKDEEVHLWDMSPVISYVGLGKEEIEKEKRLSLLDSLWWFVRNAIMKSDITTLIQLLLKLRPTELSEEKKIGPKIGSIAFAIATQSIRQAGMINPGSLMTCMGLLESQRERDVVNGIIYETLDMSTMRASGTTSFGDEYAQEAKKFLIKLSKASRMTLPSDLAKFVSSSIWASSGYLSTRKRYQSILTLSEMVLKENIWPKPNFEIRLRRNEMEPDYHPSSRVNESLWVHDWILSSRWPYFKRMLESGMEEAKKRRMEIPNFCGFLPLLHYLYSCEPPDNMDVPMCMSLWENGARYDLCEMETWEPKENFKSLFRHTLLVIESRLTIFNCLKVLQRIAEFHIPMKSTVERIIEMATSDWQKSLSSYGAPFSHLQSFLPSSISFNIMEKIGLTSSAPVTPPPCAEIVVQHPIS